jgi:ATP-binding cassette subfamily F protein 3
MLELTADRLVLVDGGTAKEFAGSLDDYTDFILGRTDGGGVEKDAPKRNRKDERRAAAEAREQSQSLRKAAKAAEAEIAKLEARKKEIERAMFDPSAAAPADAARTMTELMKLHADVGVRLSDAEARWLLACEAIESLEAA